MSISPSDLRYELRLPDVDVGRILDSSSLFYFDHILYFLFYWSRVVVWKAGIRFLVVVLPGPDCLVLSRPLSPPCLFCWVRVVCPLLVGLGSGLVAFLMRFPVLLVTASLRISHACDEPKFDPSLQI